MTRELVPHRRAKTNAAVKRPSGRNALFTKAGLYGSIIRIMLYYSSNELARIEAAERNEHERARLALELLPHCRCQEAAAPELGTHRLRLRSEAIRVLDEHLEAELRLGELEFKLLPVLSTCLENEKAAFRRPDISVEQCTCRQATLKLVDAGVLAFRAEATRALDETLASGFEGRRKEGESWYVDDVFATCLDRERAKEKAARARQQAEAEAAAIAAQQREEECKRGEAAEARYLGLEAIADKWYAAARAKEAAVAFEAIRDAADRAAERAAQLLAEIESRHQAAVARERAQEEAAARAVEEAAARASAQEEAAEKDSWARRRAEKEAARAEKAAAKAADAAFAAIAKAEAKQRRSSGRLLSRRRGSASRSETDIGGAGAGGLAAAAPPTAAEGAGEHARAEEEEEETEEEPAAVPADSLTPEERKRAAERVQARARQAKADADEIARRMLAAAEQAEQGDAAAESSLASMISQRRRERSSLRRTSSSLRKLTSMRPPEAPDAPDDFEAVAFGDLCEGLWAIGDEDTASRAQYAAQASSQSHIKGRTPPPPVSDGVAGQCAGNAIAASASEGGPQRATQNPWNLRS
jgi:hypothetical protein